MNIISIKFGAKRIAGGILAVLAGMLIGTSDAKAAITYGNGYYVNLCDSGTAATYYSCDPGCNPQTGSCSSENTGIVKWICYGKWDQCLESESQWSNYEQVDNVGCGYTVQLSRFDKKCRREDGSWDNSCRLTGYMVWYSGDCIAGQSPSPTRQITPTTRPNTSPTVTPQATAVPTATIKPSPTAGSKINNNLTPTVTVKPSPAARVCNARCTQDDDCQAGFSCISGRCRNPACTTDTSCFCSSGNATGSAVSNTTPETGWPTWVGMALMGGLGWGGIKLRKLGKSLWA